MREIDELHHPARDRRWTDVVACAWMAGCDDSYLDQSSARSQQPISSSSLAEMEKLDTTPSSPTVIRTYKKEAELEIWK